MMSKSHKNVQTILLCLWAAVIWRGTSEWVSVSAPRATYHEYTHTHTYTTHPVAVSQFNKGKFKAYIVNLVASCTGDTRIRMLKHADSWRA